MRISVALLFILAAHAQQIGQNAPAPTNGTATFQANTQLVIEAVSVKDKSGNPVEGLTAKDFTVTEDGTLQTIRFFEFQKLPEIADASQALPAAQRASPIPKLPHTQVAAETP